MMNSYEFFIILFLFMLGCIIGWIGELLFNRFISKRKRWVNPGFLQGPYLPIYGFGTVILYALSNLLNKFSLNNVLFDILFIFVVASILMTILELIGGLFFIKVMNMRLWDYSNEKFNYKGIICLRFSILWGVVSVIYYFLINPILVDVVSLFVRHIEFSFFIGIFYGFIIIDLVQTMNLSTRIRKFAKENEVVVTYLKLKDDIAHSIETNKKLVFSLPDKQDVHRYLEDFRNIISRDKEKPE